jgi:hypothetical protein
MKLYARYLPVLAIALVLPACTDSPTETDSSLMHAQASAAENGATKYIYEQVWNLDGDISGVFCDDGAESEPIRMRGKIYEKWTIMYVPNGDMHAQLSAMGVDLGGTGTITGAEYTIKAQDHSVFNRAGDKENGSYRSVYRVESKEADASFRFSVKGNFRWVDGEFQMNRERIRWECEL